MQINLQDHIKVVTNYNFKLLRNEVLLQEVNTHNILTNNFWIGNRSYYYSDKGIQSCDIKLGSGSGTPTASDSNLFHPLWQKTKDSTSSNYHARTAESNEEWIQLTNTYTFPANTTYVGTITECGLYSIVKGLCTHALLLDAEGNPISIEKTDLDVLIIEVTIRLYFTENENIKMIRADHTTFWTHLFSYDWMGCIQNNNNLEVLWSVQDSLDGNEMYLNRLARGDAYNWNSYLSTAICNGKQSIPITTPRELTFNTARLGTDWPVTGQHFIKGLRIMRSFIITFPNTDIFPAYDITGMDVGIGDGETTEFTCPMNYFVTDTDKIYIDGILQTRGVDYIVESDNNNQMLPELMACNDAIITGGYYQINEYSNNNVYAPVFRAVLNATKITGYSDSGFQEAGNRATYATMFDKDRPLFIDMQKEVKVNTFQIGSVYNYDTSYGGIKYTLSYSDDGVDYVELTTIIKTTNAVAKVTFNTITKRYFKVAIEHVSSTSNVSSGAYYNTVEASSNYSEAVNKNNLCLLGYVGRGIQFTNPPAEGAVITMDATTDLPMKNENFVFDTTLKLSY